MVGDKPLDMSGRAELRHPAPALGNDAKAHQGMDFACVLTGADA